MKATSLWNLPNTGATNSSGFTGLPGGRRIYGGIFTYFVTDGYWWSSTQSSITDAGYCYLYYNDTYAIQDYNYKTIGFSVRCVRD